jgi:hypothetical protein
MGSPSLQRLRVPKASAVKIGKTDFREKIPNCFYTNFTSIGNVNERETVWPALATINTEIYFYSSILEVIVTSKFNFSK